MIKNGKIKVLNLISCLSVFLCSLSLIFLITSLFIKNEILNSLGKILSLSGVLLSFISTRLLSSIKYLNWEEVDALLLNDHNFYVDDIAWGSYGWPAPAGDKFSIQVWERRTDGARYISVEIKNYIWFICYQTRRLIYLVPSGDSGIPHDTSLSNKEFLGIISEIDRDSLNRLFKRNGNITLYVNGRWYDNWERYDYK